MLHNITERRDETEAFPSSAHPSNEEKETTLVEDHGLKDSENPVNWPKSRKWSVTGFACFMAMMIGINGLCVSSATEQLNHRFNISDESFPNSYWLVTAWYGGAAIFPLVGLPLMENFGVRVLYLVRKPL